MQDSYIRRQELKVADKEPDCHCGKLSFRAPIGCRLPGALAHTVLILILFFFLASCFVLEDREFSLNKTITSYDLGYWTKNGVLLFFVCVYARQGWERESSWTWRDVPRVNTPFHPSIRLVREDAKTHIRLIDRRPQPPVYCVVCALAIEGGEWSSVLILIYCVVLRIQKSHTRSPHFQRVRIVDATCYHIFGDIRSHFLLLLLFLLHETGVFAHGLIKVKRYKIKRAAT